MFDFDGALAAYEEAKRIEKHVGQFDSDGATLLSSIGNIRGQQSDYKGALDAFDESERLLRKNGRFETEQGADVMRSVGNIKALQGDLAGALDADLEARQIYKKLGMLERTPAVTNEKLIAWLKPRINERSQL